MSDLQQNQVQLHVYSKWNSRRWRITLWSMATATLLLGYSIITRYTPEWFSIVMPILLAIPNLYIGAESFTKIQLHRQNGEQR